MKTKKKLAIALAVTLILSIAGPAPALMLQEEFLGGLNDFIDFPMMEPDALPINGVGNTAKFFFDLDAIVTTFNEARLIDTTGTRNVRINTLDPSIDETSFDASYSLQWATIDFWLTDFFPDGNARERLNVNIESRNTFRASESFRLENVADAEGYYKFSIDLYAEGLLDYLADGDLLAIAISPNLGNWTNSFIIDRVLLTAEAAPVPEPATVMLLGAGLLVLVVGRRRARNQ